MVILFKSLISYILTMSPSSWVAPVCMYPEELLKQLDTEAKQEVDRLLNKAPSLSLDMIIKHSLTPAVRAKNTFDQCCELLFKRTALFLVRHPPS